MLELLKKYWLHLAVALAAIAYTGFIYWEGGRAPRAELAQFRAEVEAEAEQQEMDDELDQQESDAYVAQLNAGHAARVDSINRAWDAFIAGMQPATGGQPASEPIPINAGICNDPAANQRLSDAISKYRDEVRGAIAAKQSADAEVTRQERIGTAALFAACQKQTGGLIEVQQWADHERNKIWNERPSAP